MCLGGNNGGDGGAAEREEKRQKKQQEAIARVNNLFGIYSDVNRPDEKDFYRTVIDRNNDNEWQELDRDAYNNAIALHEQSQSTNQESALENKSAREALYETTGNDVKNYYQNDLNLQKDIAGRQKRFAIARRGVGGGSSELDLSQRILDEYNKSSLNIANRGNSAAQQARASDEQARLNIIDRIRTGLGTEGAVQSATNALQNNITDARVNNQNDTLGQAFSNYAYFNDARNSQPRVDYNRQANGTYYQPKSYSGSR